MSIGSDFLTGVDGRQHAARIDAQSRVVPLGAATGFFHDGWVRKDAAFSVRALDNITSLSLEVWVPPDEGQLTITMKPSDMAEITLAATPGRISVLQFPLDIPPLGERRIELTADRERQLSDRDRRQAAYKLSCIGLY